MLRFWSPNDNPFWKMDWKKFDIYNAAKSVLVTLSLTIFAMIFAAFILHFVYPDPITFGLVLLAIATLGHLIARILSQRRLLSTPNLKKGLWTFCAFCPFRLTAFSSPVPSLPLLFAFM
ncbi:MAG: hypothetical protein N3B10_08615 [Armatimonadetes bacterium]|nr:hypothetical protein [Armatimonadota bacterium]